MLGKKVNNTRVFPVTVKIVMVFSIFIFLSNFTSNYINLVFNRSELLKLTNQLLTKDLKDIYSYCNNQYEIYQFDKNIEAAIQGIEKKGVYELKNSKKEKWAQSKALTLGFDESGAIMFQASRMARQSVFPDKAILERMNRDLAAGRGEGNISFQFNDDHYFGMYKFNPKWKMYILRGEEEGEFLADSNMIFVIISVIIIVMTIVIAVIGIFIIRFLLRFITVITSSIMRMVKSQQLDIIPLDGATNDDITYLGTAFNSLSSTVDNLITIFRKFANQDIVTKAYRDREIKLEGTKKELTILFSDIKSFTYITETLGTDIIKLLNMHYDRAIREIVSYDGVIGSIIGDALLAVFGVMDDSKGNKSQQAIMTALKLHEVTETLRIRMTNIRDEVERERGRLSADEDRVYKAVLLEIGVGIDGGEVFYGTLGSYVRMTNTVIGDNVNAASRMEGLTRVYHVPVICSEYVKDDVENNVPESGIHFVEIDTVQVKGKTTGQKIYWPLLETDFDKALSKELTSFELGLELYYQGDWPKAYKIFRRCALPLAKVFVERTTGTAPRGWKGIWEMKTK